MHTDHAPTEQGFTLLELLVVMATLAILLAVAIPTFLNSTTSAKGASARQNIHTTLLDSNMVFQSNGGTFGIGTTAQYKKFSSNMAASLSASTPGLNFTTSASTDPTNVALSVSRGGNGLVLASHSASDSCWYAIDNAMPISTINKASTTAPYGAKPTATNTHGKPATQRLVFPTSAGTWYAKVAGDPVTADCSASAPKITGSGAVYQITQTGFPS